MKKLSFIMLGVICAVAAMAQTLAVNTKPVNPLKPTPNFEWAQTVYDFGKIVVGKPVTNEFKFINTGDAPLVISSVQASCGCTVAEYSKDPIMPGGEGYVKATYNAAKAGIFTKTVTINANTENTSVLLTIKGEVVESL
jgi:hypothetical protein